MVTAKYLHRPGVIFDVDGTLCDVSSVRHHIIADLKPDGTYKKNKDFDTFHQEAVNCPPIGWVVDELREWQILGADILVVTARGEKYKRQLDWWLAEHSINADTVRMRPNKDYRKDYIVKKEILDQLRTRWYIEHAYDDNPAIVQLWQEEGISVTVVPGWEEAA